MTKILLDTNFCMIPFQFKVDIFTEIKRIVDGNYVVCVLDKTIDELNELVKIGKGKNKINAKLALQLLNKKKVKIIKTKSEKYVDDLIVDLVGDDWIVCTQDIGLRKRLKIKNNKEKKNVKIIIMRQKKYLIIV